MCGINPLPSSLIHLKWSLILNVRWISQSYLYSITIETIFKELLSAAQKAKIRSNSIVDILPALVDVQIFTLFIATQLLSESEEDYHWKFCEEVGFCRNLLRENNKTLNWPFHNLDLRCWELLTKWQEFSTLASFCFRFSWSIVKNPFEDKSLTLRFSKKTNSRINYQTKQINKTLFTGLLSLTADSANSIFLQSVIITKYFPLFPRDFS